MTSNMHKVLLATTLLAGFGVTAVGDADAAGMNAYHKMNAMPRMSAPARVATPFNPATSRPVQFGRQQSNLSAEPKLAHPDFSGLRNSASGQNAPRTPREALRPVAPSTYLRDLLAGRGTAQSPSGPVAHPPAPPFVPPSVALRPLPLVPPAARGPSGAIASPPLLPLMPPSAGLRQLPPIYVPPGMTDNPKGQGGYPAATPGTDTHIQAGPPVMGFAGPPAGPHTVVPMPAQPTRPNPVTLPPIDFATIFGSPDYGMLKDIKDLRNLLQSGGLLDGGSQPNGNADPCGQGEQTSTSSLGGGKRDNDKRLQPKTGPGEGGFTDHSSWAEDGGSGAPSGSGWERYHDDGHGNYQYYNPSTNEERLGIASRNPDGGGSGMAYRGWTDEHGHERTERVDRTEDPDGHRTQTVTETLTRRSGNQTTITTQTTTNDIDAHGNRTVTRSERYQVTFLPDGGNPHTERSGRKPRRGDSLPTDDARPHVPEGWSPLGRQYTGPPSTTRAGSPRVNPGPMDGTSSYGSTPNGSGAAAQPASPCGPQGASAPSASRTDGDGPMRLGTPMVVNPNPDRMGSGLGGGGSHVRNMGREEGGTRGPEGPGGFLQLNW